MRVSSRFCPGCQDTRVVCDLTEAEAAILREELDNVFPLPSRAVKRFKAKLAAILPAPVAAKPTPAKKT